MNRINPLYFELFPRKPTKGDRRKAAILEKTIELHGKSGIEEINFDKVAAALKIRRSHVAYYFPDKEDLLYHCMLFVLKLGQAHVVDYLRQHAAEKDAIATYVRANFDFVARYPVENRLYVLATYKASQDERWRELFLMVKQHGSARLLSILEVLGSDRNPKALKELSGQLHDLITMHYAFYLAYRPDESLKKYESRVIRLAHQLIARSQGLI